MSSLATKYARQNRVDCGTTAPHTSRVHPGFSPHFSPLVGEPLVDLLGRVELAFRKQLDRLCEFDAVDLYRIGGDIAVIL